MGISGRSIEEALQNIDPYDFENLIAKIWEKHGWETTVTASTRDKGIDVRAKQNEPIPLTIAIQAKAYKRDNKIGSDDVRRYRTLYEQEKGIDAVVIATTGRFTDQAEELAEDLEISLLDLDDITRLVSSIDMETFSNVVSPISPEQYNLQNIPYLSKKDGCPKCNTSKTLWEADLENDRQLMVCENCDATWVAKPNEKWTLIG
jgi:hypothetical protein